MDNKRFNLASHWEELEASFQKIFLKEIDFKDLMVITKGWNPTRKLRLLELRANRITENQTTIKGIEEQLTQKGHTQVPSGSQKAAQISSPVASHHSESNRSVAKSHHSSIIPGSFQEKTMIQWQKQDAFSQRKRESDPMIQNLLYLVKKV
ncbi:hypothetical protein O181_078580 [Austropuccinia psidii MF-1]|uniref:Uncharacterized protein n=1 Tax=Austropuccinia psidii MF-1 TaxID=1389203 RepID=A0A9Q3FJY1_9BASI|nr:hypothetical protein [Austropuccinia psidii MF-1]